MRNGGWGVRLFSGPTLFINFDGRISLNDSLFAVKEISDFLFFLFLHFFCFWKVTKNLNSCYIYFHGGVESPGASVCLFLTGTDPFVCEQSALSACVRVRVSW